jgi:hypothetical protein
MQNGKNVSVTSYNQSGGITAHTVNIGPAARSMDEELGQQLRQHIAATAKVTISAIMGDGEAFNFANQILGWMRANGYANVEGVNQAVYGKPVVGQTINRINDGEFAVIIGSRQ